MRANMTDLELDRAVEQAAAKEWEEQNAEPADGAKLKQAARSIRLAVEDLDKTLDLINEAAELLVDTPEGDKIASYLNDGENVLTDLRKMEEDFERRSN